MNQGKRDIFRLSEIDLHTTSYINSSASIKRTCLGFLQLDTFVWVDVHVWAEVPSDGSKCVNNIRIWWIRGPGGPLLHTPPNWNSAHLLILWVPLPAPPFFSGVLGHLLKFWVCRSPLWLHFAKCPASLQTDSWTQIYCSTELSYKACCPVCLTPNPHPNPPPQLCTC